jgi:predicted TIM-barrel fold metal-dependent hydrolase
MTVAPREAEGWDCHVHVFDASHPVAPGHYVPAHHPLDDIEALAGRHGVDRLVLVQPSVYGSDNRLVLDALRRSPGRHRGVIVADELPDESTLDTMHALGVRGVRFNLVSPVGEGGAALADRIAAWAPRLAAHGWHLQWYARAEQLETIAAWHARHRDVPAVLDHLAGLRSDIGDAHSAWYALDRLASMGAWVKLSGWYRLDAQPPYGALHDHVRRLHECFEARLVWGSDWPHTSFARERMPAYATTWQPVVDAIGREAAMVLRRRCPAIYA